MISGNADEDDVRRMVADYFGNIEPGNTFPRRAPDIHRRVTDTNEEMFDNVSTPRLYRAWNVPQDGHVDLPALTLAAHVINRRLDAALENQVAFAAAYVDPCELGSQFRILLDLRGDTDQQHVEETLNGVVATFIEQGPTTDELDGARRVLIAAGAHARASSDAMATAVVHCLDRAAAPDCVNVDVQAWQEATPGLVQDTAAAWLARGSHTLLVTPGERPRPPSEIAGEVRHAPWDPGTPEPSLSATPTRIDRTVLPALAEPGPAYFPAVARTALPNGVPLVLAPMREGRNTRVVFLFDGGRMGDLDPDTGLGVAQAVSRVLTQRAGALEKHALAQELDQLGLAVTARATEGYSTVVLQGPAANLARGLGIVKDMLADTRFPEDLLDQSRARALASIARVTTAPLFRGNVLMEQLVLGEQHPYGRDPLGEGTEATVAAMAPVQLSRWADRYLQPSNVTIVAIGRFQPATLSADLERVFGSVEGAVDRRRPDVPLPTRSAHPGVYVLWADQGSQAQVMLGYTVHRDDATHDILPICIDKIIQRRVKTALREQQGLTYEIYPLRTATRGVRVGGFISAVDRTGGIDALATARTVVADLLEGRAPVTQAELNLHLLGARRELATRFQDPLDVEAALVAAVDIGRDIQIDDVARVMTNLTSDDVNSALGHMSSNHLTWVLAVPSNRGVDESVSSETDDGQAAPAELRLRFIAMGLSHFTTIDPATGARSLHQL